MSEALLVIAPAIQTPMELMPASFMQELVATETTVARLQITDAKTAQEAADFQRMLTKAKVGLEKARTDLKAPLLTLGRAIDTAAAGPALRLEIMTRTLKTRQVAYDDEQRRIAAEEEKKRQAELKRLAEERQKELDRLQKIADDEAAENKRVADELLAKAAEAEKASGFQKPVAVDELDLAEDAPPPPQKSDTEKQIEALKYAPLPIAPAIVQPKTQGLSFRTTLKMTVTDVNLLPDTFVTKTANLAALRAVYTSPWKEGQVIPECPGVKFEINREPVTR